MRNTTYQIAAAITFFTRIPAWKIVEIPEDSYRKIICFWPLTGWITGAIMAAVWFIFSAYLPPMLTIVLALVIRILLTGGLHEDGLADFFDGFGGGKTKTDILRIMKDSHTGSYALIGMVLYYLLITNCLISIPKQFIVILFITADPFSKFSAALLMNSLPYARTQNESKSKTLYDKLSPTKLIVTGLFGMLPLFLFFNLIMLTSALVSILIMILILSFSKKKIGGYIGDICGATALLSELGFYLTSWVVNINFNKL